MIVPPSELSVDGALEFPVLVVLGFPLGIPFVPDDDDWGDSFAEGESEFVGGVSTFVGELTCVLELGGEVPLGVDDAGAGGELGCDGGDHFEPPESVPFLGGGFDAGLGSPGAGGGDEEGEEGGGDDWPREGGGDDSPREGGGELGGGDDWPGDDGGGEDGGGEDDDDGGGDEDGGGEDLEGGDSDGGDLPDPPAEFEGGGDAGGGELGLGGGEDGGGEDGVDELLSFLLLSLLPPLSPPPLLLLFLSFLFSLGLSAGGGDFPASGDDGDEPFGAGGDFESPCPDEFDEEPGVPAESDIILLILSESSSSLV